MQDDINSNGREKRKSMNEWSRLSAMVPSNCECDTHSFDEGAGAAVSTLLQTCTAIW